MLFELLVKVSRHLAHSPKMQLGHAAVPATSVFVLAVTGIRQGGADDVVDLPSVELIMVARVLDEGVIGPAILDPLGLELVKEALEDGLHHVGRQVVVADGKVDMRDDGHVDGLDTVCGQDDDSLVVLELGILACGSRLLLSSRLLAGTGDGGASGFPDTTLI